MMRINNLFLSMVVIIALTNCNQKKTVIKAYSDPMAETFWNKDVKRMIAYYSDAPALADTTFFDSVGNMVELRRIWHYERNSFDSLHFVTHNMVSGESFSNLWVTYELSDDKQLLQKWNEISDFEWKFNPSKVDSVSKYVVQFRFNEHGKIIEAINAKRGTVIKFQYDSIFRLMTKAEHSLADNLLLEKWEYDYKDNRLSEVKYFFRNALNKHFFYSKEGLIDSCLEKDSVLIKYKYEFFSRK